MKYPRTYHLPFSAGATNDDKILKDLSNLVDKSIVVTLKMDGENTSMLYNKIHARSEDSKDHPSRHWVKALHASICNYIPNDFQLCGENLFAKHSIHYKNLKSYFYLFSIWNIHKEVCLSWQETIDFARELNLVTVPVLYQGDFDLEILQNLTNLEFYEGDPVEGFVVRSQNSFGKHEFSSVVAKYVRANHVQTSTHWMYDKVIPNKLSLLSEDL